MNFHLALKNVKELNSERLEAESEVALYLPMVDLRILKKQGRWTKQSRYKLIWREKSLQQVTFH